MTERRLEPEAIAALNTYRAKRGLQPLKRNNEPAATDDEWKRMSEDAKRALWRRHGVELGAE